MSFLLIFAVILVTPASILYLAVTIMGEADDFIAFFVSLILSIAAHAFIVGYLIVFIDIFCLVRDEGLQGLQVFFE